VKKHTEGPWAVKDTHAAPEIIGGGRRIAKILYEGGSEDRQVGANARLIAAAPDLLKALEEIEAHHVEINRSVGRDESHSSTLRIARTAIKKARIQ
jgi:hypothetical protein